MKASTYAKRFKKYIEANSTQRKIAKICDSYPATINAVVNGRKNDKKIAAKAGYEIVITYEPKKGVEQWF